MTEDQCSRYPFGFSADGLASELFRTHDLPWFYIYNKVNFDNAKIQIADILSTSAPYQLPTDPVLVTRTLTEIASYARALENELKNQNHSGLYPLGSTSARLEQIYPDIELEVSDSIKRLELLGLKETFLGEESQLALLKEAMSVRNEYTSEQKAGAELKRSQFWDVYPVRMTIAYLSIRSPMPIFSGRNCTIQ